MLYEIWVEGHRSTGSYSSAELLGKIEATSFKEACINFCTSEIQKAWGNFDIKNKGTKKEYYTLWGCRLYDNEIAARKGFG